MQVLRDSLQVIDEYLTVMRREINSTKEYERLTRIVLSKIDVNNSYPSRHYEIPRLPQKTKSY